MATAAMPVVKVAPNNPVFDLPVIVGIEEGLFAKAGLDVSFSATYADREKDSADKPVLSRLKENLFECGSADSYNVCEWASIDRLERGERGGKVAALRAAVAAQTIARPIPVFPLVASMIVPPGLRRPSRSAASIMLRPMRSLTLPPGFSDSSFTSISAQFFCGMRFSRMIGVLPMTSQMLS